MQKSATSKLFLHHTKTIYNRRMDKPKLRGRPPIEPENRLIQRSIRMKQVHWDKIDSHGGEPWLRAVVEKSKVPPVKKP